MPVIIPDLQTAVQSSSNALETKPQTISPSVDPEVPQPDLSVFQPLLYQPSTGLSYQGSGTVISSTNGIKIYDEGNLVLSKAIALNFIGDAVEVTANGSTAYITISGTGGSSYGNSNVSNFLAHYGSNTISTTGNVTVNGLFANTLQNLNGLTINNGDSSHGQTSGLYIVSNGDGNATTLFNAYGNIALASSNTGAGLNFYIFDSSGNVYFPNKLSVVGSIIGNLFRITDSGNTNWQLYGNTLTATTGAKWVSNANTNDDYIISNIGGFIHFQSLYANANIASELHLEHGQAHIIVNDGTSQEWIFDSNGNLTLPGNTFSVNYANGTAVSLDGNYSNANVVANLAALGSNPISTTGNITGGNFIGTFVSPATTANTYVLYNDSGVVGGSGVFTFNESGNILTIGTTGGTLKVADISTPQAGVNLRFIPSSGTTLSYGHLNPQFANTYDLGSSSSRWNNVYANVANVITLNTVGNITGNTAGYTIGYRDIPQITFSANTTAALDDAGKHYYSTTAGNLSLTLPDNSNVALSTGATLTVVVNAAGNVLVNQGTGVSLYMAGSSTTGNRVVGAYGLASVMKVAANTWVISGTGVY